MSESPNHQRADDVGCKPKRAAAVKANADRQSQSSLIVQKRQRPATSTALTLFHTSGHDEPATPTIQQLSHGALTLQLAFKRREMPAVQLEGKMPNRNRFGSAKGSTAYTQWNRERMASKRKQSGSSSIEEDWCPGQIQALTSTLGSSIDHWREEAQEEFEVRRVRRMKSHHP
jgi:hypothetical protein